MNKDDVIRMADEADLWADQELQCIGEYHPDWHEVRDVRFAALVAAHVRETEFKPDWNNYRQGLKDGAAEEREACADLIPPQYFELRERIRARGNT